MKNFSILFFTGFLLSACSGNTVETNGISSESNDSEATQFSEKNTSQSTTEHSEEREESPYAVTLDDFIQEITLPNGDKKVIYHLDFSTTQENLPTTIVLNTKDNNEFGQAIYLTSSEGESAFYPISIKTIPTKKLTIVGNDGSERTVAVNTRVKIEATHDNVDPMALIGNEGYLFYNDQGSISFALTFANHHLIEYVQSEQ